MAVSDTEKEEKPKESGGGDVEHIFASKPLKSLIREEDETPKVEAETTSE